MTLEPGFQTFSEHYGAGRAQVVWTRLIDDLETPVSAYLKVGNGRPYAFLFESVEGGAWRGRYSVIALKPDLVWRCRGDVAEIAEGDEIAAGRFTPQPGGALESLRDLVAASRLELPTGLPPMTAGVFGAIGYDMVRLVERLPNVNPDTMGLPDAVMIRPSVVAVFDGIAQEILLATTVRPSGVTPESAWAEAGARLEAVRQDLASPTPPPVGGAGPEPDRFTTPVSREDYRRVVDQAKGYIAAGDIFQVVPSHRFRAPFPHDPFALYRSLRRTNPSPFLFYLNFGDFQLAGSSPEILV
ncbi:MAG: chorismate-binding protein, partial [Phenylobacterium sp.]